MEVAAVISLMSPTLIKHQQPSTSLPHFPVSQEAQTMGWLEPTYPDKPRASVGGVVISRRSRYRRGMIGWQRPEASNSGVFRCHSTIRISRVGGTCPCSSIASSLSSFGKDVLHPEGATAPGRATAVKDHACIHISLEARCCTPAPQTTTWTMACRRAAGGR